MTERAFVSPSERILARLRPVLVRLRPALVRLPDAAKVAALPLLLFWAVDEGLGAGMGWVYRDLLDVVSPSGFQQAVIAVIWVIPAAVHALLAAMLLIGWLRVLAGLEPAGWLSGLALNRRVMRAWALVLVMGAGHAFVEQPLFLLDLVQAGNAGLLTVAANLPGVQGLVFVLLSLVAWAPVLPLALGFVPIALGESLGLRRIVARLRGRWWRTPGTLVALLALAKLLAWAVNGPLYAAIWAPWLQDVLYEISVFWRVLAIMLVASGVAVLERRLPPAPEESSP